MHIISRTASTIALCCASIAGNCQTGGNKGFAVLELFTSEGCSSCPAAETTLNQLHKEFPMDVYVLEFHVDYWNSLGWRDVYSDHNFSLRQREYVKKMHLSSAYTPQAVVNGKDELTGSNKSGLTTLINKDLAQQPGNTVSLKASTTNGGVVVNYALGNIKGQVLNIALIQKSTEMNVRSGENAGRKLHHTNVVRVWTTVEVAAMSGSVTLSLPTGLQGKDCSVVAYTQRQDSWAVTGAAEVGL